MPSLLGLPQELQINVLSHLLVRPYRLGFTHRLIGPAKHPHKVGLPGRIHYLPSDPMRVCRLSDHFPDNCSKEDDSEELVSSFNSVTLVCKTLYIMAREIFFASNRWALHIGLTIDSLTWVYNHWGPFILKLMTDIKIVAQSTHEDTSLHIQTLLSRFVVTINNEEQLSDGEEKESSCLKRLAMQWISSQRHLSTARKYPHLSPVLRSPIHERNADATRGKSIILHYLDGTKIPNNFADYRGGGLASWAKQEWVLTPLAALRGIEGTVEGCVTEEWATWLEECMAAPKGTDVGDFERKSDPREAARGLNNAITEQKNWYKSWLQFNNEKLVWELPQSIVEEDPWIRLEIEEDYQDYIPSSSEDDD